METKNLIQASANVVRITALKEGDCFKQLEPTGYSGGEHKMFYGVVTSLFNTGSRAFIQVTRYEKSYNSIRAEIKTFDDKTDINIFPATVEEIKAFFEDALVVIERDVEKAKSDLHDKIEALKNAKLFVTGETSKKLQAVSFIEMSQAEYDAQIEARKKQLEEMNKI
jgi:hypothetical protein